MGITIPGAGTPIARVYTYYSDGTGDYREGVRNGKLYTDKLRSGGTWEQAEGVGWDVVNMIQ